MRRKWLSIAFACALLCGLTACGGGSGGTSESGSGGNPPPPPPPAADFSLQFEVPQLTLQQQGAFEFETVQVNPINGFTGTVSLSLLGVPAGVTVSPVGPYSVTINGGPQGTAFQMAASTAAATTTTSVTVTATSGPITHSAPFSLTVTPVAPFAIHLSPAGLVVTPASSTPVQISVTTSATSPPQLTTSLSDLPPNSGTTTFGPQGLVTPSTPQDFLIEAGSLAQPLTNFPITVTATDNSGNSSVATLSLTVSIPFASSSAPTRTTFAPVDGASNGAVLDAARNLLFVTVEGANEVLVLSSVDAHQVAKIPVLAPRGIDETPDGTQVVVGSAGPFITIIDPNALQVVNQIAAPVMPGGSNLDRYLPEQIATLPDGKVLILCLVTDSTESHLCFGDLTTGSMTVRDPPGITGTWITRSPDHTIAVISGQPINAGAATDALYTAATDSFSFAAAGGPYFAISPTNSQFVQPSTQSGQTNFYDANFNLIGSLSLDDITVSGALYSVDGDHVYIFGVPFAAGFPAITVVNTSTLAVEGVVPDLQSSGDATTPYAIDNTGMVFGGSTNGVAYVDVSSPGFFGLPAPGPFVFSPALLSSSAPTSTQLSGSYLTQNAGYKLYFGAPPASPSAQQATSISYVSNNFLNMTAPPISNPGPVNVTMTRSDGWSEVMPNAVSYGPQVWAVGVNAGPPGGGSMATVWGYGFDSANTQVLIGGAPAQIGQILAPVSPGLSPLSLNEIEIVTPAGSPGLADVTVNTPLGSSKIAGAFQYLSSAQVYPVSGVLEQVIYDQSRQRLYAANASNNEVEVFDLSALTYLEPIAVGNQPVALALTPDAALLAVVNSGDGTVSVIDPTKMQVVATYSALASNETPASCCQVLSATAVAPHRVLINVSYTSTFEGGTVHLLNLDTGSLSCVGTPACNADGVNVNVGPLQPMASSGDGTEVFVAGQYGFWILNYDSNTQILGPELDPFTFWQVGDAAADSDGTVFAQGFAMYDQQGLLRGDAIGGSVYLGTDVSAAADVLDSLFGEKLNPSGSLLYVPVQTATPNPGFVDIFDMHTGKLVLQVAMPEHLPALSAEVLNEMAIDETGTRLFLISNSGITVAQLAHLPLSLATVNPASGSVGTQVTLRGSGFETGATVTFGTTQVNATFVDAQTLQATVPTISPGPIRITITNPDGSSYSFDDIFAVN